MATCKTYTIGTTYRFGYQGQFAEYDFETGYNHFEARLYNPRLGRWMTTDPAGQYWSPYLAMGNNWVNVVDPDGEVATWIVGAGVGAGIGAGFEIYAQIKAGNIKFDSWGSFANGEAWAKVGIATLEGGVSGSAISTGVALFAGGTSFVAGTLGDASKQAVGGDVDWGNALITGTAKGFGAGVGTGVGNQLSNMAISRNWTGNITRNVIEKLAYNYRAQLPAMSRATFGSLFRQFGNWLKGNEAAASGQHAFTLGLWGPQVAPVELDAITIVGKAK